MKKLLLTTAAIATLAASAANSAERWPKWYVGLAGNVQFVSETDTSLGATNTGDVDFDAGWGVGGSVGYMPGGTNTFLDMMRFEVEVSYREAGLDTLTPVGGVAASISDDLSSINYMANAFYDINTNSELTPYVGAGLGITTAELNVPSLTIDDEDSAFAWQVMAGLGYSPELMPNTTFVTGYRYFATSDLKFGSPAGDFQHEYSSHIIEAGARFAF